MISKFEKLRLKIQHTHLSPAYSLRITEKEQYRLYRKYMYMYNKEENKQCIPRHYGQYKYQRAWPT